MLKIKNGYKKAIPYAFFLLGLAFPISTKFANVMFGICVGLLLLLSFDKKEKGSYEDSRFLIFSTILLFLPCLASFFTLGITEDFVNTCLKRSPYLFTPFVLYASTKRITQKTTQRLFSGFLLGSVMVSLALLINIVLQFFFVSDLEIRKGGILNYYHTNKYFTELLDIHPTYLGLYMVFAVLVIGFSIKKRSRIKNTLALTTLILAVIFINSRSVFLCLILIIVYQFYSHFIARFKNQKNASLKATIVLALLSLASFFMFNKTYIFQKMTKELFWELNPNISTKYNSKTEADSRVVRWKAAVSLIAEKPFLGHGVNQEIAKLSKAYGQNGLHHAKEQAYNAHNQFLGFSIEGGLISLMGILAFFIFSLVHAVKKQDRVHLFFIVTIGIVCIGENFLIRNAGILFVAFFSSWFLFRPSKSATYA